MTEKEHCHVYGIIKGDYSGGDIYRVGFKGRYHSRSYCLLMCDVGGEKGSPLIPFKRGGHRTAIENEDIRRQLCLVSDSFSMSSSSSVINSATEYAQRIWDQDITVCDDLDRVVEWIGNGKPCSNSILESYMMLFDFKDLFLEQAFRNLCSKLHLKGETQQIDRILSQFSIRYFECNPRCIFGTSGKILSFLKRKKDFFSSLPSLNAAV